MARLPEVGQDNNTWGTVLKGLARIVLAKGDI